MAADRNPPFHRVWRCRATVAGAPRGPVILSSHGLQGPRFCRGGGSESACPEGVALGRHGVRCLSYEFCDNLLWGGVAKALG